MAGVNVVSGAAAGASAGGGVVGGVIGAVAGAIISGLSFWGSASSRRDQLKEYKKRLERDKSFYLQQLKDTYELEEKNAIKSADRVDARATITEGKLSADYNISIDNLNMQRKNNLYAYNNAMLNINMQTGEALSNKGANGTRGGSLDTAIKLQSASNVAQLEVERSYQSRMLTNEYRSLREGLNMNLQTLQENRTDALDTRQLYSKEGDMYHGVAWAENGKAYQMWLNSYNNTEANFNDQIKDVKTQMKSTEWWHGEFWAGLGLSLIGGGLDGLSTGYDAGKLVAEYKGTNKISTWSDLAGKTTSSFTQGKLFQKLS